METSKLKKFAQFARRSLLEQVTAKLKLVLADESPARRERPQAIKKLEEAVTDQGKEQIIERVAYIWFNRFCALRFMDVNRYNRIGIVSPAEGQFQPEILADAKMGHIDEEMVSEPTRQKIFALLDGKTPSQDPQGEAYRLLVVAACNYWYSAMPFLFERIDDYTELLMPDDLLSGNSILAYTREAMTPDACRDVEIIGWLYQFYISEKKDQVFSDLKKNKKVTPENIPAATQLFTPHWIVRYLVENSLGRLWILNRPDSGLAEQMDYYVKPDESETDFLRISSPEEIKICDPACGSGHMLTYAFDLLYAIYEEEGYEPADIPAKILTHNLYGIEIDERAGELAAFALTMKAAAGNPKEEKSKHRRFFRNPIQPNICVLENVHFDEGELKDYMDFVGRDLFTAPLQTTLRQFEEADNFGSLIRPDLTDVDGILKILEAKDVSAQLFLSETHNKALQALRQADYLSPKYHVVIANPPYMGARNMTGRLSSWLKDNYQDVKSDLFSAFIVRNAELTLSDGQLGFMSPFVWMFISSYEALRDFLINQKTITSLVQLEYSGFDGATVPICTFTIQNSHLPNFKGGYVRLSDFRGSENQGPRTLEAVKNPKCGWFYRASANDFRKIPGEPIAYWATPNQRSAFDKFPAIASWAPVKQGLATADNSRFVRTWNEISINKMGLGYESTDQTQNSEHKWFPYNKGGDFRKWYGNFEFVVLWENDGHEIRNFADDSGYIRSRAQNTNSYFKQGVTWTFISSSKFGVRYAPSGSVFDVAGSSAFPPVKYAKRLTAFLASNLSWGLLKLLNPTLNFQVGNVASLPLSKEKLDCIPEEVSDSLILQAKLDWDSYETSWDFTSLPLLNPEYRQPTLKATYQNLRAHWREITLEMQQLEKENNRIFIEAYGLQDELTPEVPLEEITLTCNPYYRYGNNKSEEELEALLLADTMRELVSYAVGCMLGRYALDKPGLILANQGETVEDYLKQIAEPSFPADDDNVIPMLDGDWFTDDITERFREFLRIAFGEEHYGENLRFVEQALGKDIRKYFLKDFYNDHVRRYKKRPIYWLFSSPKGSFNALIYMHRYQPHTVGTVLEYLRDFKDEKLKARKNHLEAVSISAGASQGEKTKALKEIEKINKILAELDDYERDVLYPLATEQVEIDLDDGVKANYPKFGDALKKIPGLS
ncbi:BREX-1 system adenine-specific DNA-methyltransferase PglX [Alloalcanivorax xenomutans]|uniref:BREX-1 system adenine-specific DNA-methyltransferase PglX n=1 Tax=Alloalcanivorax xenomutans TaxID=1094342 RepID=UPI00292F8F75|nr:BREX-1 system adenine-specific DNA-methyltransferase PglX [Alloalcanivorax xenomutans]WOA31651.1 BREX-1 system adenine-specific DNA-methyltransferase PglX [Alloalcanivorax xenomutans]